MIEIGPREAKILQKVKKNGHFENGQFGPFKMIYDLSFC